MKSQGLISRGCVCKVDMVGVYQWCESRGYFRVGRGCFGTGSRSEGLIVNSSLGFRYGVHRNEWFI